jgi:hypothetical protein
MSNHTFWDEYEIKARYIPCLITAIPLVHFLLQFLGANFWKTIALNVSWLLIANISLSLIVTLALIQLQCGIAKHWVEEGIFGKGGINFPTTYLLLFQNNFLSRGIKVALRDKIYNDFHFKLMDEDQECNDIEEAKRSIREAVGLIRGYVCKGRMLHQYNISYGFMRNLIGGSLWAFPGCVGSSVLYGLQKDWIPMSFFAVSSMIFLATLIFKKQILSKIAHQYADTLLNEYLNMKGVAK